MSSDDGAAYKVQILDARFKLCVRKPNAGVLMPHSGDATAMYPYVHGSLKIAFVSKESTVTARTICSKGTFRHN